MKNLFRSSFVFVLVLVAVAAACTGGEEEIDTTQVFTAVDYAFQGPDTVPAGWTELRIANIGRELHHAQLVSLPDGVSAAGLLATLGAAEPDPDLLASLTFAGGPSAAAPGTATSAYAKLEVGEYLLICAIPTPQGVPLYALGMFKALTVTANPEPAEPPESDLSVNIVDFGFELSGQVEAGTHTFRVTNSGPQNHEAFLVELSRAATVDDFLAAVAPGASADASPPGNPVGGVQAIGAGDEGYFTSTFVSNRRYVLLCFVEDTESGLPHFAQGMVREFTVQ